MELQSPLDMRDIFYCAVGLGLLGLTLQPFFSRYKFTNVSAFYVAFGAGLAALGLPVIDPRGGGLSAVIIEHGAELIVIISLAGAGLAIDTKGSLRNWEAAFRLLIVAMPLTILGVWLLGGLFLGLSLAGCALLAASLAPTDPVLARSIQVGPPGEDETSMQVALTAEAGLNDGLAFPFVYLAITLATAGMAGGTYLPGWFGEWLWFDVGYRVAAGLAMGWLCGTVMTMLIFSPAGDAQQGAWNSILMVLAATFLAYGATEAIDGYGFLAVFIAARRGRGQSRGTKMEGYEKFVHHGADQLESILLVLLLLWFGMFLGAGGLTGLAWGEVAFALALVFVLRPAAGMLALMFYDCPSMERRKVSFFGIRGMGSIFYIAYAQNHADFADIDAIWRIASVTILVSIIVHGFAANFAVTNAADGEDGDDDGSEVHPLKEHAGG